jgi:hypothetical protein
MPMPEVELTLGKDVVLGKKALLFLQKKKQKNSYLRRVAAPAGQTPTVNRSFLVLFFKKELLSDG